MVRAGRDRVDAHVDGEVARLREGLLALVALVGLHARVHALVPREAPRAAERLLAHVARVGFLARVRPLVHQEVGRVQVRLACTPHLHSQLLRHQESGRHHGVLHERGVPQVPHS